MASAPYAPAFMETGQAARVLGVSPFRVRQLADEGKLPVVLRTARGRRLFDPEAVERLRDERARTKRPKYWRDGAWHVGSLPEVPGVFSQGKTLGELAENLRDAARLVGE